MAKQKITEKMRTALATIAFLFLWLVFGSSANILSPTNGSLGILFGSLFSITLILGPIYYVKFRDIKVKNPKPLFVEPSAWLATPLSFAISGLLFFIYLIVLSIPSFDFILDQLGEDTFIGNSVMMIVSFTSLFGPITIFFVYTRMHYNRIVEYNSTEWKKVKKGRKASKGR